MTTTSPTTSTAGLGTGTFSPSADPSMANALGKDDFLKLLMAQLQFQDPMNPLQDHEFVAQLAQFSSLEQQMQSNQKLGELQLAQLSSGNAQLAGFIGQDIVARGNQLSIEGGEPQPISIDLPAQAASVRVTVRDADGKVVSSFDAGNQPAGNRSIPWTGRDASGQPLPDGEYTVEISAVDPSGRPLDASTLVRGRVTGLSFEKGFAELVVGDRTIAPADIVSVQQPTAAPTSSGANTTSG
ncbi:MAG: flagellar hook assembly protein FlgD [Nannocystaceae bacterium]|nr:flagellar hook assembly protein FlgD [Nannocystaceae bacterium]